MKYFICFFPHEVFRSGILVMLWCTSMLANHTSGSQDPLDTGDCFTGQHHSSLGASRRVFSSPAHTTVYFSKSLNTLFQGAKTP